MRSILLYFISAAYIIATYLVLIVYGMNVIPAMMMISMAIKVLSFPINRKIEITIKVPEALTYDGLTHALCKAYILSSIKIDKDSKVPMTAFKLCFELDTSARAIIGKAGIPAYVELLKKVESGIEYETVTYCGYDFNITALAIFVCLKLEYAMVAQQVVDKSTKEYQVLRSNLIRFVHDEDSKKLDHESYVAGLKTIYNDTISILEVHG